MGNSLADVLLGNVNPSGKLPFTWAKHYSDYSSATNFPESDGNPAIVRYEEDVMVGYRHFDKEGIEPLFPFGYGLSYTTFAYGDMEMVVGTEDVGIGIEVKNTGKVAGREVVQLYVGQPRVDGLLQPKKELKAFAKTGVIAPGESEVVTLRLSKDDLTYFNEDTHAWTFIPGDYSIYVGASATDIRCQGKVKL